MIFLQTAASRITDWLVRGGGIPQESREVYEFGLNKLLSTLVNFLFAVCLGLVLAVPLQTLVFYAAYHSLRVYAGGYHADTQVRCFFISIGIMIPTILAIRFQQAWHSTKSFYLLLALGVAILVWLSPVENRNKQPDELEKTVYRRRLLRNLGLASGIAILLSVLTYQAYSASVLCGILLAAAMAVGGKVKLFFQARA